MRRKLHSYAGAAYSSGPLRPMLPCVFSSSGFKPRAASVSHWRIGVEATTLCMGLCAHASSFTQGTHMPPSRPSGTCRPLSWVGRGCVGDRNLRLASGRPYRRPGYRDPIRPPPPLPPQQNQKDALSAARRAWIAVAQRVYLLGQGNFRCIGLVVFIILSHASAGSTCL